MPSCATLAVVDRVTERALAEFFCFVNHAVIAFDVTADGGLDMIKPLAGGVGVDDEETFVVFHTAFLKLSE